MQPLKVLLLITLAAGIAFPQAQMSAGNVAGTVTDQSGAVVPGSTVTITNVETGGMRSTETVALGAFRFLLLPPGVYELKVEAPGFGVYTRSSIQVTVGQTAVIPAIGSRRRAQARFGRHARPVPCDPGARLQPAGASSRSTPTKPSWPRRGRSGGPTSSEPVTAIALRSNARRPKSSSGARSCPGADSPRPTPGCNSRSRR